ncbi:MAG TPA: hypothetical protein VFP54_10015 [Acidimicrobiales bacterium]|nr:hypothetical protein [Acidimicrobiales bacterium]
MSSSEDRVLDTSAGDRAAAVMDEVAATADSVAADQHRLARSARATARSWRDGRTWAAMSEQGTVPAVVSGLASGAAEVAMATARLRASLFQALVSEGWTVRRVGHLFGVSHQRVSSMLSRSKS